MLDLQSTAGNRAVAGLLSGSGPAGQMAVQRDEDDELSVGSVVGSVVEGVGQAVGGVAGGAVGGVVEGVSQGVSGVVEGVGQQVGGVVEGVGQGVDGVVGGVRETANGVIDGVVGGVQQTAGSVVEGVEQTVDSVRQTANGVVDGAVDGIGQAVGSVVEGAGGLTNDTGGGADAGARPTDAGEVRSQSSATFPELKLTVPVGSLSFAQGRKGGSGSAPGTQVEMTVPIAAMSPQLLAAAATGKSFAVVTIRAPFGTITQHDVVIAAISVSESTASLSLSSRSAEVKPATE